MFKKEDIEKVIEECNKSPENKGFVFIQYDDENHDNDGIFLGGTPEMKQDLFYTLILHLTNFKVDKILKLCSDLTKFIDERDKTLSAEELKNTKGETGYEC